MILVNASLLLLASVIHLIEKDVTIYSGPGAVGNNIPTIEVIIQIITPITMAFSQPILYIHRKDNNQAIPPTIPANKPLPNR